jgi:uncharacterized membrane protein/nitrite reductase/ring-hydroxylating ferredoxin subunit
MRSKASYGGHPIHPMLIPFPFAFLTGAFLFDVAGWSIANVNLARTGAHLTIAGLGAGVLAAVPGVIDYFGSVPPGSSAKTRATKHAVANVSALALFAASWLMRADDTPSISTLGLQLTGLALMSAGGYMGGTLVFRNQIGVDHRYAKAGKWQEVSVPDSGEPVIAEAGDLELDQMKLVHVGARRVALGRTERGYRAFDDRCTHRGGPLSDGVLMCGTVQCPWHGSQFDTTSGEVKCGPATKTIDTFPVQESNGQVRLRRERSARDAT